MISQHYTDCIVLYMLLLFIGGAMMIVVNNVYGRAIQMGPADLSISIVSGVCVHHIFISHVLSVHQAISHMHFTLYIPI